jgi:hypothetical protein
MNIKQYAANIAGASTGFPFTIPQDNILFVGLSDVVGGVLTLTASPISRVNQEIGNLPSGGSATTALLDHTNLIRNKEATQSLMAVIYEANGDITSQLQDGVKLTFSTTGAATPQVAVMSANFDYERLVSSAKTQIDKLSLIQRVKANNPDATKTIQRLGGAAPVTSVR